MVPGIGPSADPVLQARMFSYPDAHRYRVGPNYFQLPPNKPVNCVYAPYVRDGPGTMNGNYGADPDYVGSNLCPVSTSKRVQMPTHEIWSGQVTAFATTLDEERDFKQARDLWQIISKEEGGREQFLHNIVPTLKDVPEKLKREVVGKFCSLCDDAWAAVCEQVQLLTIFSPAYFGKVHSELGSLLAAAIS